MVQLIQVSSANVNGAPATLHHRPADGTGQQIGKHGYASMPTCQRLRASPPPQSTRLNSSPLAGLQPTLTSCSSASASGKILLPTARSTQLSLDSGILNSGSRSATCSDNSACGSLTGPRPATSVAPAAKDWTRTGIRERAHGTQAHSAVPGFPRKSAPQFPVEEKNSVQVLSQAEDLASAEFLRHTDSLYSLRHAAAAGQPPPPSRAERVVQRSDALKTEFKTEFLQELMQRRGNPKREDDQASPDVEKQKYNSDWQCSRAEATIK